MKAFLRIISVVLIMLTVTAPVAVSADPEIPVIVLKPGEKPGDQGGHLKAPGVCIYAHYGDGYLIIDLSESIDGTCVLEVNGTVYRHYVVSASELRAGIYVGNGITEIVLTLPNGRVYTANI